MQQAINLNLNPQFAQACDLTFYYFRSDIMHTIS